MNGYIETFRGVVYPWHCDHQGHMTTMHYVGMFDAAFWHFLSAQGFTRAFLAERTAGFADVSDSIRYLAELPVGSPVTIESGLLKVGNTSVASFNRMIELPQHVEPNKVSAEFKHGVLTVTLPKKEEVKARRIEVKSG